MLLTSSSNRSSVACGRLEGSSPSRERRLFIVVFGERVSHRRKEIRYSLRCGMQYTIKPGRKNYEGGILLLEISSFGCWWGVNTRTPRIRALSLQEFEVCYCVIYLSLWFLQSILYPLDLLLGSCGGTWREAACVIFRSGFASLVSSGSGSAHEEKKTNL